MSKMTIVQLGVIVFAICLSTQAAENNTDPTSTTSTNPNSTTMVTDTNISSANTTDTSGAGISLHAGTFSFLIPVTMAASLLQRYC
ncbi:hypothetical protein OYC64_005021 [Pagothenia borchgrevinki]|uniref:Uncharacterized protein n=1 Tax=Pagothenia borchgrevinki TaxID=8213 RepID=A0ABD2GFH2_PAGBO